MISRVGVLIFLFFLFSASTCEREVTLDLDAPADKLVVYSTFEAGDTLRLQVSKSNEVVGNALDEFLPEAQVRLYEGNTFLENLKFIIPERADQPPYYKSSKDDWIKEGHTYRVEAQLDGFEQVNAQSMVPISVAIQYFNFFDLVIDEDTNPGFKSYSYHSNVKINDPSEETNYYHLIVYQEILRTITQQGMTDTLHLLTPLTFDVSSSTNDVVSYINRGILIKDNPFNEGYRFDIEKGTLLINPFVENIGRVIVELRTVSEGYYLFHTAIAQQQDFTDVLFSEPVIIYNNVNNGYGIFAGYSSYWAAIDLQE